MPKNKEQELFGTFVPIEDKLVVESTGVTPPQMGSPEWSSWALGHLADDEKDKKNGLPKTEGLKRLVQLLVGDIVISKSHLVCAPSHDNLFMNIVEHTIVIECYGSGRQKEFTAVGESNESNTDLPFGKFPSSVASTRAMGRTYRDALQVKGCVAEELADVAIEGDDAKLTSTQKAGIESMCKKLSISVDKFINSGTFQYRSIERVSNGTAKAMISLLNRYQQGTPVPPEVRL